MQKENCCYGVHILRSKQIMKKTKAQMLLENKKKKQSEHKSKVFQKIIGNKKNTSKFDKVNFNG